MIDIWRDTMKDKIEQILAKHDPVKLIKIGVPQDEYSSEAQMICDRIDQFFSVEKIQDIVYEAFIHQFSGGSCFSMNHGMLEYTGERAPSLIKAEPIIGTYDQYRGIAEDIKKILPAP
jgi:hypothetical protein